MSSLLTSLDGTVQIYANRYFILLMSTCLYNGLAIDHMLLSGPEVDQETGKKKRWIQPFDMAKRNVKEGDAANSISLLVNSN